MFLLMPPAIILETLIIKMGDDKLWSYPRKS
jgi:hypothetical protein